MGQPDAAHLRPVLRALVHHVFRDYAVGDDPRVAVNVIQEAVECEDPLREAGLELTPLAGGQDPRQAVDRDDALVRLVVTVDGEGDPLVQERPGDALLDIEQFLGRDLRKRLLQEPAVRARRAAPLEHLVVDGVVEFVPVEVHDGYAPTISRRWGPAVEREDDTEEGDAGEIEDRQRQTRCFRGGAGREQQRGGGEDREA